MTTKVVLYDRTQDPDWKHPVFYRFRGMPSPTVRMVTAFLNEDCIVFTVLLDRWFLPKNVELLIGNEYWRRTIVGPRLKFVMKDGLLTIRHSFGYTHRTVHNDFFFGLFLSEYKDEIVNMVCQYFGIDLDVPCGVDFRLEMRRMAYPILTHSSYDGVLPPVLRTLFRCHTPYEVARKIYGRKTTKAHVREVASCIKENRFSPLFNSYVLRGLIPVDWHLDVLRGAGRAYDDIEYPAIHVVAVRRMLAHVRLRRRVPMLEEPIGFRLLLDSWHMWEFCHQLDVDVDVSRCRTTGEVHEVVLREYQRLNPPVQYHGDGDRVDLHSEIDQKPYEEILALSDGEYEFVSPKVGTDLIEWGQMMNHCIGSYAREAIAGNGLFLLVKRHEEVVCNIHISAGRIDQMFARHNALVPRETAVEILARLNLQLSRFMVNVYGRDEFVPDDPEMF